MSLTLTENAHFEALIGHGQSVDGQPYESDKNCIPVAPRAGGSKDRPKLELADVLYQFEEDFLNKFGASTSSRQRRVMGNITNCRTPAMGGHVARCK